MKRSVLFLLLFHLSCLISLSTYKTVSNIESPIPKEDKYSVFKSQLKDFVFDYNPEHKLLMTQSIFDEWNKENSNKEEQPFDFITYWKNSLKGFCNSISELKKPKISHYSIEETKKEEGFPTVYMGKLFISSKDDVVIKSRFSAMEWKGVIYLMNIKVPKNE